MLGNSLPQGSEAISFQNTLFRVSELCWIKAVKLSVPEIVVRVIAVLLGVGWIFAMQQAKGTYANLEFLLAVFPLMLAWNISGSLKIGCSGDFEESYDSRRGLQSSLFQGWIDTIRKREPDWLHFTSTNYDLLLNPHRVAWVRPCFQWKFFPLFVAALFGGYVALLNLKLDLANLPVFDDYRVLIFDNGDGTVRLLSYLVILVSIVAFALSIKRSVEVCGTGGVQDVLPVTSEDQASFLAILAGHEHAQPASVRAVKTPSAVESEPRPKGSGSKSVMVEAHPAVQESGVALDESKTVIREPKPSKPLDPAEEKTIEAPPSVS